MTESSKSNYGIAILGSTGSIGCNSLRVLASLPGEMRVVALAAAWLVVLVPMVARRRQQVARTTDSALAARVVRSGRNEDREEFAMSDLGKSRPSVEDDLAELEAELELEDEIVNSLTRFEDVGFKVSAEEWKHGVEPAPDLNFSAAGAAVHWANGAEWSQIVRETRAEEGDLFRMFSRTGEALLQVAGLRRSHPQAAEMAAAVADAVLRDPIR